MSNLDRAVDLCVQGNRWEDIAATLGDEGQPLYPSPQAARVEVEAEVIRRAHRDGLVARFLPGTRGPIYHEPPPKTWDQEMHERRVAPKPPPPPPPPPPWGDPDWHDGRARALIERSHGPQGTWEQAHADLMEASAHASLAVSARLASLSDQLTGTSQ